MDESQSIDASGGRPKAAANGAHGQIDAGAAPSCSQLKHHASTESPPLVGVVVPMFNATGTIESTLKSICAQTHRNLDIIVVDDGSNDDSALKVMAWTHRDPRLRLVRQTNSGVAAARNLGAALSTAEFLAFIDADDLWAPAKVETQLDAIIKGGDEVGLAYSWFALIDDTDRVLSLAHQPEVEGQALGRMLRTHVVGNGSSALFSRAAFERVGGFDTRLRERGAEGCEDLEICLRVAEHYEIRVVKRHLVGYRILSNNMSSDPNRMLRSCELVLSEYRERFPELGEDIEYHLDHRRYWSLVRAASEGHYRIAYDLLKQLWESNSSLLSRRIPQFLVAVSRANGSRALRKVIHVQRPRLRYLEHGW
jgi:glycosyltransferase involved in cell wall biosynthesis